MFRSYVSRLADLSGLRCVGALSALGTAPQFWYFMNARKAVSETWLSATLDGVWLLAASPETGIAGHLPCERGSAAAPNDHKSQLPSKSRCIIRLMHFQRSLFESELSDLEQQEIDSFLHTKLL
jgi:hypothetical protein